jgi:P27 family predicted phage terminase small subunit
MPAGRPRKPTKLKILEGEPNKDRINYNEPQPPEGDERCPSFLSPEARKEWKRIVPELKALGLFTTIDRAELAIYCQNWGRYVQAERGLKKITNCLHRTEAGNIITSPLLWVANKAADLAHKSLIEFGMTPASRSRISVNNDKDLEDELDIFLNTGKMN